MSGRLGELLVRENLITPQALRRAEEESRKMGSHIAVALIKTRAIAEPTLTDFLSKLYGVPAINLKDFDIHPVIIELVPRALAEKHLAIPVNRSGSSLVVAMSDPLNITAVDILKFRTGCNIEPVVASEIAIREAIDRYYGEKGPSIKDIVPPEDYEDPEDPKGEDPNIEEEAKAADDAPVVKLVNLILTEAIKRGASDIHIESYEKDFRVRFRIDGSLHEAMRPPMKLRNAIISRLKIMAKLDISERRLPQDGRIKLTIDGGKEMDFRVSVSPMLFGEKVVMRLLDKSNLQLDMTRLGFNPQQLQWFQKALNRPYGMVLVTGPTGSGKTTTLYSALSSLNQIDTNISTAEDPVEFNFAGINQMQIHEDVGLTFPVALRSFLRQDPDIIMIGEIRDLSTGEIAVKAALTGHLVLSTLHTNDAPGTVSRLLDMGIAPFLVTSSLNLVIAQRLCRRLCKDCRRPVTDVDEKALIAEGVPPEKIGTFTLYEKAGCRECNDRGYRGRVAVYEVMPFWDGLKELVISGAPSSKLKQEAIRLGMSSLRMSALAKMMEGVTTLEEVVTHTAPDQF
jgi:type IV pilus assembly protein PilB